MVAICTAKLDGKKLRFFVTSYIRKFRKIFKINLFRRKN